MKLARETEFMKRMRDIEPEQLIWSLVHSFSMNQAHEMTGLHRSFIKDTHQKVCYSAFRDQITKEAFPRFITALYQQQVSQLYLDHRDKLPGIFDRFQDVRLHDGSSWAFYQSISCCH